MPTENRSSNTEQMVSVPRELLERCDFGKNTAVAMAALPELRALLARPAAQPHGEPVAFIQIPKNVEKYGHADQEDRLKFGKPGQFFANGESPMFDFVPLYLHPPTSDGFSAGDMADQGSKAFAARDGEVQELRAKLAEQESQCANLRATINAVRTVFEDNVDVVEYIDALMTGSAEPSSPVEPGQGIPGTSFQRLNMLANRGE